MDKAWKKEAVVYQIYPRSFYDSNQDGLGDILGIIAKIPYLVELGIDALWLSPVYQSPMDDNGYDISDYCAINPDYGTLDDMKMLIQKLHEHNIKIIMDLVINHTSDEHPWFIESKQSINNPKRDYYIWRDGKKNNKLPPNNWTSFFTGKAWTLDETTQQYYLHLFGKKQPDLNWENPEVIEELKKIITFWIDLGVDGFRCDVINLISKHPDLPNGRRRIALTGREHYFNGPKVHEHIKKIAKEIFIPKGVLTVGEAIYVTPEEAMLYVGENREELDMVFHFEHMSVDTINNKWFIRVFKPRRLKKVLDKWQNKLYPNGWNALYFENHDQPRSISRFGNTNEFWCESAKMLATILYFQRGTPYIYQGQEIGMTNASYQSLEDYRDIETHNIYKIGRNVLHFSHKRMMKKIRYMSRDNARTPMQWTNAVQAGFTKGNPWIKINPNYEEINVESQNEDKDSILSYYKKIIALRKQYRVIIYGNYQSYKLSHKSLYMYSRSTGDEQIVVIANFSAKFKSYSLPQELRNYEFTSILTNYSLENNTLLRPYEVRVFYRKLNK